MFGGEDLQLQRQGADDKAAASEVVCGVVVASRLLLADVQGMVRVYSLARRCRSTAPLLYAHQLFSETSLLAAAISSVNCAAFLGNDAHAPLLLKVLDVDSGFPNSILELSLQRFISTGASVEILSMTPNAQQIALGLSDGSIVLLTLLNFEKKPLKNSDVGVSGWLLSPPQPYSLSGLHFCLLPPTMGATQKVPCKTIKSN